MSDPILDVLRGLAAQLAADGVGTWSPSAAVSGDWPIALITPPATDKSITLTHYAADRRPGLVNVLTAVNVRIRGDRSPTTAGDKAGEVYASLQGRRGLLPNGVRVTQVFWASEALVGPDQNGRQDKSINYYVQHDVAAIEAT